MATNQYSSNPEKVSVCIVQGFTSTLHVDVSLIYNGFIDLESIEKKYINENDSFDGHG